MRNRAMYSVTLHYNHSSTTQVVLDNDNLAHVFSTWGRAHRVCPTECGTLILEGVWYITVEKLP